MIHGSEQRAGILETLDLERDLWQLEIENHFQELLCIIKHCLLLFIRNKEFSCYRRNTFRSPRLFCFSRQSVFNSG